MTEIKTFAAAALIMCGLAVAASAQTTAEPAPKADAGTTIQADCIDENDHYKMSGKQPIIISTGWSSSNKCEQRMRCRVFVAAYHLAKGVSQGRGTIVLAGKSGGAAAKGSYVMKARMIGGSSQSTRECAVF